MKHLLSLSLVAMIILAGCGKDEDNNSPEILTVRVNGTAITDEADLNAGDQLELRISVRDDDELNQLKIDIHADDDGHAHEEGEEGSADAYGFWEELDIVNLEGAETTAELTYTVPASIRGTWHLGVLAIDASGNEANPKFFSLHVENAFIPEIHVTAVNGTAPGAELDISEGEEITFEGTAADADGLFSIEVAIFDANENSLLEESFDAMGATSYDLSAISLTMPTMTTAEGELVIAAVDMNGLTYQWHIDLHIE